MALEEIRSQLKETEAVEALVAAYSLEVQHSLKANVDFGGIEEDIAIQCPAPGFVLSFSKGDYLHIKQDYTEDWLIGRVVGSDTGLGFLPSEKLLQKVTDDKRGVAEPGDVLYQVIVYQKAPIVRPIVLMGPSLKGCNLTDSLQNALLGVLTRKFSDRLVIVKSKASVSSLSPRQAYELKSQVYEAGKSNHIVYLDCDASCPSEISNLELHPLIVYIQVSRIEVLNKLLRSTCQDKSKRSELLAAANYLYDLPRGNFSLILTDSFLDVASRKLELFLESYWISTHPPIPPT
ncbi:PREDICTED: voltage-dependent L-type calcium channel subunit beta-1-like [Amphimedon queenslandica]|uniref:Guanylate kinase/L-type calcium channel beta subunit domain-containing protein n=1 Tax=Amphimedon queenslandica TaxID=400682 RepID=A0A1X7VDR4_AMPQE|nr:PREDICTED: voltage-dependent L-type calcium channel subunit beta-1-like [Amphimedon queenslandica]|eukprot:XP_011410569.1 PREDICTED: voltage-dependent L-type calcium channel subunit beta-1-like [Amphimedon queenslandica]